MVTKAKQPARPSLAELRTIVARKYGDEVLAALSPGDIEHHVAVIPTGAVLLDRAIEAGGWPRGRLIELFGKESSGKSTLALAGLRVAQGLGLAGGYFDYENAFDPLYAQACGVDLASDRFMLTQPDSLEQGMGVLEEYLRAGALGYAVIDSLAAMPLKAELEGELDDPKPMALRARTFSTILRRLTPLIADSGAVVIFVNHMTEVIGGYNPTGRTRYTTPGGSALKFYASVRVELTAYAGDKAKRLNPISGKMEDEVITSIVRARVAKNKVGPPFRKAEFEMGATGIDELRTIVKVAIGRDIIQQRGSRYLLPFPNAKGDGALNLQGMAAVLALLTEQPGKWRALRTKVIEVLDNEQADSPSAEEPGDPVPELVAAFEAAAGAPDGADLGADVAPMDDVGAE